jgi:hypothetical protein
MCIVAISGLLDGEYCSQKTGTKPLHVQVSTTRQGQSGLGLEAQRQVIEAFAASRSAQITGRFTEVESGRNPNRPELARALHLAKVTGPS